MKIINETPRKMLRYLMFSHKNKIQLMEPVLGEQQDKDVINFYESMPDFTSWDDFETKWDIGMGDDMVAKVNRKEKWFLTDAGKDEIVFRPEDYWEKEAVRRGISTHALFTMEAHQRGVDIKEFFELIF